MKKLLNTQNTLIISLAIIVALLSLFLVKDRKEAPGDDSRFGYEGEIISSVEGGNALAPEAGIDFQEEWRRWSEAIDKLGPVKAYAAFKDAFRGYHFGTQHSAAHIFGEILYDKTGLSGVVVCDAAFAFGCYHSFFSKALYVEGESAIDDLDRACVNTHGKLGTGCQHGIGHGILQYTGVDNLKRALELCRKTTQKVPTFGCTSGVFMEYNVPLRSNQSGNYSTVARKFDPINPYEPCPDIEESNFRESCYYEMAQWWKNATNMSFEGIGELCASVEGELFRKSCYLGMGNVVAPSNDYIVDKSIDACRSVPEEWGQRVCLSGASWSFFANPDYRHLSRLICEELDGDNKVRCAQDADIIGSHLNKTNDQ